MEMEISLEEIEQGPDMYYCGNTEIFGSIRHRKHS